jgi:pimeloyl-ACP methyl ester carboxylesterase
MIDTKSATLHVPGATLYYEVRGSGPILLILQGGDGDAAGAGDLVNHLAGRFTVVTYDRRGLSRSSIDDPATYSGLATHGEDAHHLLAALTTAPAFVFGNSIGALIGLDLMAHHPEQVRRLVAHEPPAMDVLSDTERAQVERAQAELEETSRREGGDAAARKGFAAMGLDFNDREPEVVLPQPTPQRATNLQFFRTYDAPAAHRYRLDVAALKSVAPRIVPAGGQTSREFWAHHSAEALANLLGVEFVEFPGGHNGHILRPKAFAAKLAEVLDGG